MTQSAVVGKMSHRVSHDVGGFCNRVLRVSLCSWSCQIQARRATKASMAEGSALALKPRPMINHAETTTPNTTIIKRTNATFDL
jgi:hypothetical protein